MDHGMVEWWAALLLEHAVPKQTTRGEKDKPHIAYAPPKDVLSEDRKTGCYFFSDPCEGTPGRIWCEHLRGDRMTQEMGSIPCTMVTRWKRRQKMDSRNTQTADSIEQTLCLRKTKETIFLAWEWTDGGRRKILSLTFCILSLRDS